MDRKEIYNVRNTECQKVFNENTSNNTKLAEALEHVDITKGGAKWIKEVKHQITQSFKKIRVSTVKVKENDKLKDLFERKVI